MNAARRDVAGSGSIIRTKSDHLASNNIKKRTLNFSRPRAAPNRGWQGRQVTENFVVEKVLMVLDWFTELQRAVAP